MNKKIEKGQATRAALIDAAAGLFATRGYADVSIDDVLAETDVSRGALYHHFPGKEALFLAVFEALEARIARETVARAGGVATAAKALRAGCEAFLDLTQEQAVRQIVLIDAPSVLGWQTWREIDARHGFGLLKASLARANTQGAIPAALVETYAHMLLAALTEVAMLIARTDDQAKATRDGKAAIGALIEKLLR
jgi:AcrR family transcriptional regulator